MCFRSMAGLKKKVQSASLRQVDFLAGQVNGKQEVAAKCEDGLNKGQAGIQDFFEPRMDDPF